MTFIKHKRFVEVRNNAIVTNNFFGRYGRKKHHKVIIFEFQKLLKTWFILREKLLVDRNLSIRYFVILSNCVNRQPTQSPRDKQLNQIVWYPTAM